MADNGWTDVFTVTIDGREVTGKTYVDGGYRVSTTIKSDYEGNVSGDASSTLIMPPVGAGSPVDIDGEDLEDLENELATSGEFTDAQVKEIMGNFGNK